MQWHHFRQIAATTQEGGLDFHIHPISRRKVCSTALSNLPKVTSLLDATQLVVARRKFGTLIAAAFARSHEAGHGPVDCHNLRPGIHLHHWHLEGITSIATEATEKAGIFQRMKDLVAPNKVLELGLGFAPQNLLEPATTSLSHFELVTPIHVGLQGIASAIHSHCHLVRVR